MRICIDLDGVVAELKSEGQTYADVDPVPGAVEKLAALRSEGHYVILNTARHMKTTEANVGRVIAKVGQVTLDWLSRYEVEYDEIWFGKPWADVYIDDNALRFVSWSDISDDGSDLPVSSERRRDEPT